MIHPTARRLDEPPMLFGFTLGQLVALALGTIGAWVGYDVVHIAFRPLFVLWSFGVLLPVLMHRVTESGGVDPGRLLRDAIAMAVRGVDHPAGPGDRTVGLLVFHDPDAPVRTVRERDAVVIPWD